MSEHDRQADRLEREVDEMQEQADRLGQEIEDTRDDWERKKRDENVPGAAGDPDHAEEDLPPEADYPSRGD